jgi:ribosomal subunit interface protein
MMAMKVSEDSVVTMPAPWPILSGSVPQNPRKTHLTPRFSDFTIGSVRRMVNGPSFQPQGGEMRYQISGHQIDIGEALTSHVKSELGEAIAKYSDRPTDAQVIFSKRGHEYHCETTVHLSTGLNAKAGGRANEIYAAFDDCREKLEKQLRRYKRRLKDHYRDRKEPVEVFGAASYILAASEDVVGDLEPETLTPMIIAEMETQIPSLSVGEAVMQMELAGAPVLVFRPEGETAVNVVYRREDGNIGWIDPKTGT